MCSINLFEARWPERQRDLPDSAESGFQVHFEVFLLSKIAPRHHCTRFTAQSKLESRREIGVQAAAIGRRKVHQFDPTHRCD